MFLIAPSATPVDGTVQPPGAPLQSASERRANGSIHLLQSRPLIEVRQIRRKVAPREPRNRERAFYERAICQC